MNGGTMFKRFALVTLFFATTTYAETKPAPIEKQKAILPLTKPTEKVDPATAEKQKAILRLYKAQGIIESMNPLLEGSIDQMQSELEARKVPVKKEDIKAYATELRKLVDQEFEYAAGALARYVSMDDIQAAIKFYESDAGKHFGDASKKVMAETSERFQAMTQKIMETHEKFIEKIAPEKKPTENKGVAPKK
jgi:hypothetical protein